MSSSAKTIVSTLFSRAGVTVGGSEAWDVAVHDDRFYARALTQGNLGLGEAYMDGWWDTPAVDQFIEKLVLANLQDEVRYDLPTVVSYLRGTLLNMQRARVEEVGEKHYDIGNDLYERMLDRRLIYSCGYWTGATTLDEAQEHKLDLICRKLGLEKGMRILDVGSGWGGLLKFAAERYGVSGVGITISKEQAAYANAHSDGLPVETRLMDYMALEGQFDRIVSVGMFEHVGYKNYRAYMRKLASLLRPDGLFLLHTIGGSYTSRHGDPWSEKYIFPNGMLPSSKQIAAAAERVFIVEDWHNFGADYDRTLMAWHSNFEAAWPELQEKYGQRFYRMWRYYLLSFAALFRARRVQLWQIVLSPEGVRGGYRSIR
jgi:cyclopropane-fatty-acyl-phospholipid synthase